MAAFVLPEPNGRIAAVLPLGSAGLGFSESARIADLHDRGECAARRRDVLFSPHGTVLRRPKLILSERLGVSPPSPCH